METEEDSLLQQVHTSVMRASDSQQLSDPVVGYDFAQGLDYAALITSFLSTGFQASHLGQAIALVNQMLDWRLSHEPVDANCSDEHRDPSYRERVKCKVFLGFTSNMISSGVRESIRFLTENKMVDVIVTTAGGIEEDLIKCLAPSFLGKFSLPGAQLRSRGLNRIGNLLVPNENYCKFEDWILPILDQLLLEQKQKGIIWTPSKVVARLGKEINNPSSYLYWAQKDFPHLYGALQNLLLTV